MKRTRGWPWRLASFASLGFLRALTLAVPSALAATIHVPGPGIATIQDGINAAVNGDTVFVADGTYYEGIDFEGKLITVMSEHGPQDCIINGGGSSRGVAFTKGETGQTRLEGFTITNCRATEGGAIHLEAHSSPIINNCVIQGNTATQYCGGGINCHNSSPIISNCTISHNAARTEGGGGIACLDGASPSIAGCVITYNSADNGHGGAVYCHNSSPTISDCSLVNNAAYGGVASSVVTRLPGSPTAPSPAITRRGSVAASRSMDPLPR